MTQQAKALIQREAVMMYCMRNGVRWSLAEFRELFPVRTITRPRTITICSLKRGTCLVTIRDGQPCIQYYQVFRTIQDMIDSGYITDPHDVLRVQELLANPTETVEDTSA